MKTIINGFNIHHRIEKLEEKVSAFPSTQQKYSVLHKELDQTFDALTHLKTEEFATKQLEETVVRLYGELENNLVKRELSQIQEKTTSLKKGRISQKALGQLQRHIKELKANHRTLSQDRQIIQAAEETLLKAQRKVKDARRLDPVFQEMDVNYTPMDFLDPTEAYDLLEVARHLHDGNVTLARKQFLELPQPHKDRFEKLMSNLPATAFEDQIPTIQALIATVNALVGNGEGYPAPSEIDQYFLKPEASAKESSKIVKIDFN